MKTRLICSLGAALLAAAGLYAQSSQTLVANVPFGFHVGSVTLPAGEYKVDMPTAAGVVRVISADRKGGAIIMSFGREALKHNDEGKLVFNRSREAKRAAVAPAGPPRDLWQRFASRPGVAWPNPSGV
jgi:hypothetical protein